MGGNDALLFRDNAVAKPAKIEFTCSAFFCRVNVEVTYCSHYRYKILGRSSRQLLPHSELRHGLLFCSVTDFCSVPLLSSSG